MKVGISFIVTQFVQHCIIVYLKYNDIVQKIHHFMPRSDYSKDVLVNGCQRRVVLQQI